MSKQRCHSHNIVVCERIEPCPKYPYGAIRLLDRHHGEQCETVISLSPMSEQKQVVKSDSMPASLAAQ